MRDPLNGESVQELRNVHEIEDAAADGLFRPDDGLTVVDGVAPPDDAPRFWRSSAALCTAFLCIGAAVPFSDPLGSGGTGPPMIEILPGKFDMGWFDVGTGGDVERGTRNAARHMKPVRTVTIEDVFAMSVDEVTVGDFRAFSRRTGYRTVAERNAGRRKVVSLAGKRGCIHFTATGARDAALQFEIGYTWRKPGYTSGDRHAAVCMARRDAVAYAEWLATETGHPYRLSSEAEWEYAARAGVPVSDLRGLVSDSDEAVWRQLVSGRPLATPGPVDRGIPNSFGLRGMRTYVETGGLVAEWTADCWHPTYKGARDDGDPRTDGDCTRGVVRGDVLRPFVGRNAVQLGRNGDLSTTALGFRVVRSPLSGPLAGHRP